MHISDGILSSEVAISTAAIAGAFLLYSLKGIKNKNIALISAMTALFFIASFVHIPLGFVQIHLLLIGIIGIILVFQIFLAIFIALLFQGVLLGYGGITSLGANILIMSLPGVFIFYIFKLKLLNFFNEKIKYFMVGFLSVLFSTILLALVLSLSKEEYLYASYTIFLANIPGMFIEGFISLFLINYIKKTMPNLIKDSNL